MNSYYARLGGVTNDEMMKLELDFLKLIDFKSHVSTKEFNKYQEEIIKSQSCDNK
jgi:hypothetical protein